MLTSNNVSAVLLTGDGHPSGVFHLANPQHWIENLVGIFPGLQLPSHWETHMRQY